jgi:hypothetical protein
MTSDDETQDEPMMDGATDATAREEWDGKKAQNDADAARAGALDDNLRSIRAVGENRDSESVDDGKAP